LFGHILYRGASGVAAPTPVSKNQTARGLTARGGEGERMRVLHPVELLAEAYEIEAGGPESGVGSRG